MFCLNEFAFTIQVKHKINSIQILGFILICLYFTTVHYHTCVLGSVFSDCVIFYGLQEVTQVGLLVKGDGNAKEFGGEDILRRIYG